VAHCKCSDSLCRNYIILFALTPNFAASAADLTKCAIGEIDERIANCTAIIQKGRLNRNELAAAYDGRCWVYNLEGDYPRPTYAYAYNNRGVALEKLGRLEDALSSCERALSLKPDFKNCTRQFLRRAKIKQDRHPPVGPAPPSSHSPSCEKYPDLC
jgi:tetratricopeptide (TPR) repeat protein